MPQQRPPMPEGSSRQQRSKPLNETVWKCCRCATVVEKSGVVSGAAQLIDGRLHCARCIVHTKPPSKHGAYVRVVALATFVIGAVAAIVFTPRTETAEPQKHFDPAVEMDSARKLLADNHVGEASARRLQLQAMAESTEDKAAAARALDGVRELDKEIRAWYERQYGQLSPTELEIIEQLTIAYSTHTPSGELKFPEIRLSGDVLSLKAVGSDAANANVDSPDAETIGRRSEHRNERRSSGRQPVMSGPAATEEARLVLVLLFRSFPNIATIELNWRMGDDRKTYRLGRAHFKDILQAGADLAVISTKKEAPVPGKDTPSKPSPDPRR
jgi:hypothetical protein